MTALKIIHPSSNTTKVSKKPTAGKGSQFICGALSKCLVLHGWVLGYFFHARYDGRGHRRADRPLRPSKYFVQHAVFANHGQPISFSFEAPPVVFLQFAPTKENLAWPHVFKEHNEKGLGIKPFCSIAEVWHLFVKILDKRLRTKIAHSPDHPATVHIMHLLQDRHFQPYLAGFFDGNIHILDIMLNEKARIKITLEHPWRHVAHLPGAGSALADGIQHGLEIQPYFFGIGHGFAYAGNGAAQGNLVGHFGMLARTCFAFIQDGSAHCLENGQALFIGFFSPPTMMDSVPFFAPTSPPDTGASRAF